MSDARRFLQEAIDDSLQLKSAFFKSNSQQILDLSAWLREARDNGTQALIFGNGGSAADAQHFAAELVHRVENTNLSVRAHALHTDSSLLTALANDEGFKSVYARQIEVLALPGDLIIGITTSGNSPNVVEALAVGKSKGCRTVGLLGREGGEARRHCDLALIVPHSSTPRIQEVHGMIIHLVCQLLEKGL